MTLAASLGGWSVGGFAPVCSLVKVKGRITKGFGASIFPKDAVGWRFSILLSQWRTVVHLEIHESLRLRLGSVWSCRNADGSLKYPIFPLFRNCQRVAVLPSQACQMVLELGSSHPSLKEIKTFSCLSLSERPRDHHFIYCFFFT